MVQLVWSQVSFSRKLLLGIDLFQSFHAQAALAAVRAAHQTSVHYSDTP